jgi:hypothetical protein
LIAHLVCRLVGHERSVSSAHRIKGVWHSRCKRCGASIIRVRQCKWRVENAELWRTHLGNAENR